MIDSHLTAAFAIGLAGAGHCVGMCGGIAAALNLGGPQSATTTVAYHAGRLTSYTLLGAMLGLAAGSIDLAGWTLALRYLAGILLVGMGLYIANWWNAMLLLERAGAKLWLPIQRLSSCFLPTRHWYQAFALGGCWGLMPCGLIYSSLAFAATAQDTLKSALMMFCFGLGTLPAMLAVSLGASRIKTLLQRRGLKRAIAVLLIASGLWTLYITAMHSEHLLDPAMEHHPETGHDQAPHHHHPN